MRWFACIPWLLAVATATLAGCAGNSMVMKGQVDKYQQQQVAMSRQQQLLQDRTNSLDEDNQELASLLAQARQENKIVQDQLGALRDQLQDITGQLADAQEARKSSDNKVRALTASLQRRGGVSIAPNNSLLQTLPGINLPDVYVRRDGDVVRVELPGYQLFESGGSRLRPGADAIIRNAAGELHATYPDQIIGVEGHTDSDPVAGDQWRSNHELSVARAMAVYDVLHSLTRFQQNQLFVVGHGPNHPIASNATPAGKQRNRRVELVVYPEERG